MAPGHLTWSSTNQTEHIAVFHRLAFSIVCKVCFAYPFESCVFNAILNFGLTFQPKGSVSVQIQIQIKVHANHIKVLLIASCMENTLHYYESISWWRDLMIALSALQVFCLENILSMKLCHIEPLICIQGHFTKPSLIQMMAFCLCGGNYFLFFKCLVKETVNWPVKLDAI